MGHSLRLVITQIQLHQHKVDGESTAREEHQLGAKPVHLPAGSDQRIHSPQPNRQPKVDSRGRMTQIIDPLDREWLMRGDMNKKPKVLWHVAGK